MAKLGYHILLEKPMAVTEDDCRKIKEVMINFFLPELVFLVQSSAVLYIFSIPVHRKKDDMTPCSRVNPRVLRRITLSWSVQSWLYPFTRACKENGVILRVCHMITLPTLYVMTCEENDVILTVCDKIVLFSLSRRARRTTSPDGLSNNTQLSLLRRARR